MHVVRIDAAPAYEAPGHHLMEMRRLQGREAGPADTVWLGLSTLAPGGGTTLDASGVEKIYLVIEGEIVLSNGSEEVRLAARDSCRIAPGEGRQLRNDSAAPAVVLLVMPLQPAAGTAPRDPTPARTAGAS
ncbi:cupin domain-containing protein [Xanthobacter sp. V3C-3]|uniref:cupin domain-containing protein n=1 Tax=Xanthobacter lutulentifluminis TaxID=3119935 RepID=UPI00372C0B18